MGCCKSCCIQSIGRWAWAQVFINVLSFPQVRVSIKWCFSNLKTEWKFRKQLHKYILVFKCSPLHWQLFKRQSIFMELPRRKYKWLSGTRWVEHWTEALDSHLINLPILIRFCDQQISSPHSNTIKKLKSKLEGVRKSMTSVMTLIFNSVKLDILQVVWPMSKILQETSLLSPTLLATCTVTMENISWMSDLIDNWKEKGKIKELFPCTLKVLDSLKKEIAN